jgi:hypothetical protein
MPPEIDIQLAFIGHLDTVAAYDLDHYGYQENGDQVTGLGTADMKSGCAAMAAVSTAEAFSMITAVDYRLIMSLNFAEHLKVTTFLSSSVMSSPVAGFLPLRACFSLTQNLPNPLINTSSPDSSALLMTSTSVSTISMDFFFVNPSLSLIFSMI